MDMAYDATVGDITHSVYRAVELFEDSTLVEEIRKQIMTLDFSWENSAAKYIEVYRYKFFRSSFSYIHT
jgi:starch synthase